MGIFKYWSTLSTCFNTLNLWQTVDAKFTVCIYVSHHQNLQERTDHSFRMQSFQPKQSGNTRAAGCQGLWAFSVFPYALWSRRAALDENCVGSLQTTLTSDLPAQTAPWYTRVTMCHNGTLQRRPPKNGGHSEKMLMLHGRRETAENNKSNERVTTIWNGDKGLKSGQSGLKELNFLSKTSTTITLALFSFLLS